MEREDKPFLKWDQRNANWFVASIGGHLLVVTRGTLTGAGGGLRHAEQSYKWCFRHTQEGQNWPFGEPIYNTNYQAMVGAEKAAVEFISKEIGIINGLVERYKKSS